MHGRKRRADKVVERPEKGVTVYLSVRSIHNRQGLGWASRDAEGVEMSKHDVVSRITMCLIGTQYGIEEVGCECSFVKWPHCAV